MLKVPRQVATHKERAAAALRRAAIRRELHARLQRWHLWHAGRTGLMRTLSKTIKHIVRRNIGTAFAAWESRVNTSAVTFSCEVCT